MPYVIFGIALVVAVVATWFIAVAYRKNIAEAKVGKAEDKAREIIDEALKSAEAKKREILLEAKEESLKTKNEIDKEVKDRRNELQRLEKRVLSREENLDRKSEAVEKKEAALNKRENELNAIKSEIADLEAKRTQELERISGLTSEQAKEYLLKTVEDEVKHEAAVMIKELETRAKEEADKKAKDYVVTAIQKCAADHVSETTISLVQLPNDEMKGRIIGREGRNIRTLETMTGVDLIIDDTPEAVILSSFDPVRREVARIALEKLIIDGRIHPARIEEMVEKA
ncbi:MAG: Rnase Y domain-containing protein, partial [Ruminococcus sp.]|nr:Rnase Y domain-containing protein [Ruminococcus sp.]